MEFDSHPDRQRWKISMPQWHTPRSMATLWLLACRGGRGRSISNHVGEEVSPNAGGRRLAEKWWGINALECAREELYPPMPRLHQQRVVRQFRQRRFDRLLARFA